DPRVLPALTRLTRTANLLNPIIAFATPVQTTCNYLSLFFRNIGSSLSESDTVGTFLRANPIVPPQWADSESGPPAARANGRAGDAAAPPRDSSLHANPYPNTAAPGQPHQCSAGNETYTKGHQVFGNGDSRNTTNVDQTTRELSK